MQLSIIKERVISNIPSTANESFTPKRTATEIKLILRGRKYRKYLEIWYDDLRFGGYANHDIDIDKIQFVSWCTCNFGVYCIELNIGKVDIIENRNILESIDKWNEEKRQKDKINTMCGFYREVLDEIGEFQDEDGENPLEAILENIRLVKVLNGHGTMISLLQRIDRETILQADNEKLTQATTKAELDLKKANEIIKAYETRILSLETTREEYKKNLRAAITAFISKYRSDEEMDEY